MVSPMLDTRLSGIDEEQIANASLLTEIGSVVRPCTISQSRPEINLKALINDDKETIPEFQVNFRILAKIYILFIK